MSRSLSSSSGVFGWPEDPTVALQPSGFSRSQSNAGLFEWRSPASHLPRKLSHLTAGKPKREWSSAASERSFTPPTNAWQGGKHGGKWSWWERRERADPVSCSLHSHVWDWPWRRATGTR